MARHPDWRCDPLIRRRRAVYPLAWAGKFYWLPCSNYLPRVRGSRDSELCHRINFAFHGR